MARTDVPEEVQRQIHERLRGDGARVLRRVGGEQGALVPEQNRDVCGQHRHGEAEQLELGWADTPPPQQPEHEGETCEGWGPFRDRPQTQDKPARQPTLAVSEQETDDQGCRRNEVETELPEERI